MAPDLMRDGSETQARLIGELLLYENGLSWDDGSKKWSDGSLRIPGLGYNDSLGVNRNNDGTYEFFTAGMILNRDDDAFEAWKDYNGSEKYDVRDNTSASMWKKNLFTGETWSTIFGGAWTSIDVTSGSEVTVDGHTYKGNTIISDYFKMHLQAYGNSEKYGVSRVGVLTDALLLNGDFLNKTGTTVNDSIPWYLHPFSQNAGSAGCIGPMSAEYFEGSWNKPNEPTSGAWYMDQFLQQADQYGLYDGYEFNMYLGGRVRP